LQEAFQKGFSFHKIWIFSSPRVLKIPDSKMFWAKVFINLSTLLWKSPHLSDWIQSKIFPFQKIWLKSEFSRGFWNHKVPSWNLELESFHLTFFMENLENVGNLSRICSSIYQIQDPMFSRTTHAREFWVVSSSLAQFSNLLQSCHWKIQGIFAQFLACKTKLKLFFLKIMRLEVFRLNFHKNSRMIPRKNRRVLGFLKKNLFSTSKIIDSSSFKT